MKHFAFFVFILVCFNTQSLRAEHTIKVLILESPDVPLPTEKAEKIGQINGEILIDDTVYRGSFEVKQDENGLHFISSLPFEKYIEGVIAAEIGQEWALEALKAQAVAARTYAMYQQTGTGERDYQITSSMFHQSYKGENTNETISRAVKETEGEILLYKGKPIQAFYHSACRGNTELPDEVWGESLPYLRSVPCKGENSPYEQWRRRFYRDEIKKALKTGDIKDMSITAFTSTGRVKLLKIAAEDSETEVKAVDLRRLLGYRELPSTSFSITIEGDEIIFEGGGYGHGVGLSQWGALELANEGKNYKEILKHYYPGAVLIKQW